MSEFIVKTWEVTVYGHGAGRFVSGTRGKALAEAWRCDAFNRLSFKEFLKIARCRKAEDGPGFGRPITVEGRPAFFIDRNGAYVRVVFPDSDVILCAHPYDVLPEDARPLAYRSTPSTSGEGKR